MALIDPLLKTTRSPIWVHPLLWSIDHLKTFGISVQQIDPQNTDPLNHHETDVSSSRTDKRLVGGFIGSRNLRYILQDIQSLDMYLASFIKQTISTFQKSMKPKPFRYYSEEQRPKPASPLFTFDNIVIQIHPELVVRTKKGFPFLMYNCKERIKSLRLNFPNTRAGSDIDWALKQIVGSLDFRSELIDPYDVGGLLALAQEQLSAFSRAGQAVPDKIKIYLMTPHNSLAAVYLYTAKIPLSYLAALHNPHRTIEETVIITRELIDLPNPSSTCDKKITDGPFLNVLARILEEALEYEML